MSNNKKLSTKYSVLAVIYGFIAVFCGGVGMLYYLITMYSDGTFSFERLGLAGLGLCIMIIFSILSEHESDKSLFYTLHYIMELEEQVQQELEKEETEKNGEEK